ncbi:hypothetical protein SDC9_134490 [bioreactor metagenome]|uniref:Uncharacterized protein n=1 Tax=bioreactor metagenome TaxID=1076179 RepID=A0A645DDB6_9ZZZZ
MGDGNSSLHLGERIQTRLAGMEFTRKTLMENGGNQTGRIHPNRPCHPATVRQRRKTERGDRLRDSDRRSRVRPEVSGAAIPDWRHLCCLQNNSLRKRTLRIPKRLREHPFTLTGSARSEKRPTAIRTLPGARMGI